MMGSFALFPMIQWHFLSPAKMAALGLVLLLPVLCLSLFFVLSNGDTVILEWELFSVGGVSFFFPILIDKLSLTFAFVVSLISFRVMLFTVTYMSGDSNLEYFVYIVMMFVLSMNFLIFIPHLLILLLG